MSVAPSGLKTQRAYIADDVIATRPIKDFRSRKIFRHRILFQIVSMLTSILRHKCTTGGLGENASMTAVCGSCARRVLRSQKGALTSPH